MIIETTLPAPVLAALAPAVEAVTAAAVAGVREVEEPRLVRKAQAVVRNHGARAYGPPVQLILADAFPGSAPAESAPDEDEDEDEDEEPCGEACSVCGCCGECGEAHEADESHPDLYRNRQGEAHCASCEHLCE